MRACLPMVAAASLLVVVGCIRKTRLPADDDTAGSASGDDDVTADDDTGWPDDDTGSGGCEDSAIDPDPDGSSYGLVSLSGDIQPLIDVGCDCHQQGNPDIEDLSPGRTWSAWVEAPSMYDAGEVLVVPGDPEASVVFWKVFDCFPLFPFVGEGMPPNAPPLTIDEVTLYYNSILQGALEN